MRHRYEGRKFGREADHRGAMLKNLVKDLIKHERITTTHPKAKEARRLAERMVTYSKRGTMHHRRLAYRVLQDETLVKKLFDDLGPRYTERAGGYTRIYLNGFRKGDCAPMAILEFVDRVVKQVEEPKKKDKATDSAKAE